MKMNVLKTVAEAITLLAAGMALTLAAPANDGHAPDNLAPGLSLPGILHGAAAIDALGQNLPAVALAYGHTPDELRGLLQSDSSLHVDQKGRLLYVDDGVPEATAPQTQQ